MKKNVFLIFGSIFLVISLLAILVLYLWFHKKPVPVEKESEGSAASVNLPDNSKVQAVISVKVTSPRAGDKISSPLDISGEARGNWFFEAVFPIKLIDDSGSIIGETQAQAQGDWMTEDFVPFRATLTFDPGRSASGVLIFEKDNPSGLPQNGASYKVPILFGK